MAYVTDLRTVLQSSLAGEFDPVTGTLLQTRDGVLHANAQCWTLRDTIDVARVDEHRRQVTLTMGDVRVALEGGKICPGCSWLMASSRNGGLLAGTLPQAILAYESAKGRHKSIKSVTASTSASAIQKRLQEIPGHIKRLEECEKKMGGHPRIHSALSELIQSYQQVQAQLSSYATSDSARAKLEEKVKRAMLPKRFQGQEVHLDATAHIIGISPMPRGNTQVDAVIDAYALRRDAVAVLVAPAYMYAFLLQQLYPKPTSNTLVVSTPAPEDKELCEVIAGVWDPEGEGALACMQAAIQAAQALQGT